MDRAAWENVQETEDAKLAPVTEGLVCTELHVEASMSDFEDSVPFGLEWAHALTEGPMVSADDARELAEVASGKAPFHVELVATDADDPDHDGMLVAVSAGAAKVALMYDCAGREVSRHVVVDRAKFAETMARMVAYLAKYTS